MDRAGDTRHACCGGGVAFAARAAGCLGIIIDGAATDIQELRAYAMPVWARGLSPITCKPRFIGGEFCVPISCGGVPVTPGDVVFADENGVLVMPPSDIETSAERAIGMQQAEKTALARVTNGESFPDINGTSARIAEILAAQRTRKP
jgi:regulator of RNase E activity RraA